MGNELNEFESLKNDMNEMISSQCNLTLPSQRIDINCSMAYTNVQARACKLKTKLKQENILIYSHFLTVHCKFLPKRSFLLKPREK